ncbi:uncharacterized protein LOC144444446 [Glandiceps talaboti]
MASLGRTGKWNTREVKLDNPIFETDLKVQVQDQGHAEIIHFRNEEYENIQVQSTDDAIKYLQRQKRKKICGFLVFIIVIMGLVATVLYLTVGYGKYLLHQTNPEMTYLSTTDRPVEEVHSSIL